MDEVVVIWESHHVEKPEFRLYYDERGNVISYTCEKLEGTYIVVDSHTFAEARPDVKIVNERLIKNNYGSVVSRLHKDVVGTLCEIEDVSIITKSDGQYWKLKTHEL